MSKRSSNYFYELPLQNKTQLEYYQELNCRYQILFYNSDEMLLTGIVFFQNIKSISQVIDILKCNENPRSVVKQLSSSSKQDKDSIMELIESYRTHSNSQHIWETNEQGPYRYKREKKETTNPLSETIMRELLKNHDMMRELITQNQELVAQNSKLVEKLSVSPSCTNTNSNNNNKFNLQFFLNETCKDAITLDAFLEEIEINEEDLKYCRDNGFVKSTCNILLKKLSKYGIHERPLHCTDLKRLIIHIKEIAGWNKEEGTEKLIKGIKKLQPRQMTKALEISSETIEEESLLLQNVLGGFGGPEYDKNCDLVIKEIAKSITV